MKESILSIILQESGTFKGSLRAKGILLDTMDRIIGLTAKLMIVVLVTFGILIGCLIYIYMG